MNVGALAASNPDPLRSLAVLPTFGPSMRSSRFALVALFAIACNACGDPPPSNYPTQSYYVEDTRLGPSDQLDVVVYLGGGSQKLEDVSKIYDVSADGSISFPMIGTVVVTNHSPSEVEAEIRTRLADGYIVNPNVTVQVKEYKSKKISIFGEVRKPGTLNWRSAMTINEAVSEANGFTAMAKPNAVVVTRRAAEGTTEKFTVPVEKIANSKAPPFFMRPGDSIYVPKRLW